ncbi:response regulator [Alteromonas sediminis]|uniref:Response regulator n=1 Tax=Alteromonas sediminis TaxID=2259342 RepID=A0A3N5Y607_9ALTE|nr:response regulator [Alteromonas sediminis]RPJ68686.1 response regulator [Alteromonas sediminis]
MNSFPPIKPDKNLNVLVIDDQALVHEIVQKALHELGVENVVCTQTAYRALRECEREVFDIVMLAFNVSEDKDGFHLFEELRLYGHITDATTVIFLSAETSAQLVNCIVEMQPDDFWVKPLDRRRVMSRLSHMFAMRHTFHKLNCCIEKEDFSGAIYQADRILSLHNFKEFHQKLRRIKGDCLIKLFAFKDAEEYYSELMNEYEAGWIRVGKVKAMLRQEKVEEAQPLIEELLVRDDTRFPVYDLLAQYHIQHADYASAYSQMQQACELAPRNMDRNRKLWDLARLNHDRHGQLKAVQAMAKNAKNSIHDSPMLSVNVVRASIDLASTKTGGESDLLLKKAEELLGRLKNTCSRQPDMLEALAIAEARIASSRSDKKKAESIIENNSINDEIRSVEDSLDKMKVFHELGMRERCLKILDGLKSHIAGDTLSNEVVNAYIEQESIERQEVNFTTKELKQMAASHYQNARYEPAFDTLRQARTLSPDDTSIALSLLKVAAQLKPLGGLGAEHQEVVEEANNVLTAAKLAPQQQEKYADYKASLFSDEQNHA